MLQLIRTRIWSELVSVPYLAKILCKATNIRWIMEKAREFQKNIYFCFIDSAKALDCVGHNKLWKILKEMDGRKVMTNLDSILKAETLLCQQRSV